MQDKAERQRSKERDRQRSKNRQEKRVWRESEVQREIYNRVNYSRGDSNRMGWR